MKPCSLGLSRFGSISRYFYSPAANKLISLLTFAKVLLNKPELLKKVWQALDRISDEALMGEGRVYGGGVHKLEPRELGKALAVNILEFLPKRSVPEL